MTRERILLLSITMNILFIAGTVGYKLRGIINDKKESTRNYNIVMYGNSITAGGNWNKELCRRDIKNCGTCGFTTSHFLIGLKVQVVDYKPKICFVEGGINDILVGIPLSRTFKNYESIIDTLVKYKIKPVIQSTLYILYNDGYTNFKVDSLNCFLVDLSRRKGISYIDLNKSLSENRRLKNVFTTDGIHINENAYQIWAQEVKKVLKLMGI